VELFVTVVVVSETASLPAESCIALLEVSEFADGAVYATDTVSPPTTALAKVNCTVEPLTTTELTERDAPATKTANALVAAVVA
jgi:hypothetical protein